MRIICDVGPQAWPVNIASSAPGLVPAYGHSLADGSVSFWVPAAPVWPLRNIIVT